MDTDIITFNDLPKLIGDMCFQLQRLSVKLDNIEELTRQIPQAQPVTITHKPLTTDEVCKLVHRKKDTVYKLARAGEIPCYKKGKFLEFFEDEILQWLAERRIVSTEQAVCDAENYCRTHRL